MKIIDAIKNLNRKTYISLFGTLFVLAAIPLTVFVAQNVRQLQTPAAVNPTCKNFDSEKFGVLPNKAVSEAVASQLATDKKSIKSEEEKLVFKDQNLISNTLKERRKNLVRTMALCPEQALKNLYSLSEIENYKKVSPGNIEELREFEGKLNISHIDYKNNNPGYLYTLITDNGEQINLHIVKGLHAYIESRTRIKVRGAFLDNNLIFDGSKELKYANDITGGYEVISQPGNPPVIGEQKTIALSVSGIPLLPEIARPNMSATMEVLKGIVAKNSEDVASVNYTILGTEVIVRNVDCQTFVTNEQQVIDEIDSQVDFNTYSRVVVFSPFRTLNCDYGGFASVIGKKEYSTQEGKKDLSIAWVTGDGGLAEAIRTTPHEYGHSLGLNHAGFYECNQSPGFRLEEGCVDKYGDRSDPMGLGYDLSGTFSGIHRLRLGWLKESNVTIVDKSSAYVLHRLEAKLDHQPQMLLVPTRGAGGFLYLEYRDPHETNFSVIEGYRGLLVRGDSPNPKADYVLFNFKPTDLYPDPDDPAIGVGGSFVDPGSGNLIKVEAKTDDFIVVSVVLANQPSTEQVKTNTEINWNKPTGYLVAAGQRKVVDYSDAYYKFDLKCTYGYKCDTAHFNQWTDCHDWPKASLDIADGACPTFTTAGNIVNVPLYSGNNYTYRVSIVTQNGDREWIAENPVWDNPKVTKVDSNCSGVCTYQISWPRVTYRIYLQKSSDSNPACGGGDYNTVSGCNDYIATDAIGDNSKVTFRGLPSGVSFKAVIKTGDFNGNVHTLQTISGLGSSDTYSNNCNSTGGSCTIPTLNFNGNEPLVWAVRANSTNGQVLKDAVIGRADATGAFTGSWVWNYAVTAFPTSFDSCSAAGMECDSNSVSNNNTSNGILLVGLTAGKQYKKQVCISSCQTTSNVYKTEIASLNPVAPSLRTPTTACQNSNTLTSANFSWNVPTGAVFENQYIDIGTDPNKLTSNVVNVTQGSFASPTPFIPGTNVYWRISSKIKGGSLITSPVSRLATPACGNPPLLIPGLGLVGDYYATTTLPAPSAIPSQFKLSRKETSINFSWGLGSPDPTIPGDKFLARYTWRANFDNDIYRFTVLGDDSASVYLDGSSTPLMRVNRAQQQIALKMSAGVHTIKVDYIDVEGEANVRFNFFKAKDCMDINGDKIINSIDQSLISKNFGAIGTTPWDVNLDGLVNSIDLQQISLKFNTTCSY